jgi:hypothetical protein
VDHQSYQHQHSPRGRLGEATSDIAVHVGAAAPKSAAPNCGVEPVDLVILATATLNHL